MFGLIVGTLCLVALIATVRRRRYARFMHFGYAGPWGEPFGWRPHYHDYGHFRSRHARGRRGFLYGLFRRLDTTPGQEKAIVGLVDGVREQLGDVRTEFAAARRELAAALACDVLDPATLEAAFRRHTELLGKLGRDVQAALIGVHEALDPEQRKQLAELLADGSFQPRMVGGHACGY
jgi:Spy/CpxP family protein refolding chaperone